MGDKRIRYGHVEGPGKGKEYPMAATQYFARRGGKFVYLAAGAVTMCGSANDPSGWCETPKDDNASQSYVSAATDKCFVITGLSDVFEMPVNEALASLAASQIGLVFKLYKTGATKSTVQTARVRNTTKTAGVKLIDVDTENSGNRVAIVSMHPEYTLI